MKTFLSESLGFISRFFEVVIQEIAEKIGLGDKWQAFTAWLRSEKSHRQIVWAVGLIALSLFIVWTYSCSQQPDI